MFSDRIMSDEEWDLLTTGAEVEGFEEESAEALGRTIKRRKRTHKKRHKQKGPERLKAKLRRKKKKHDPHTIRMKKTYKPRPGTRRHASAPPTSLRGRIVKLARQRPDLAPVLEQILQDA